MKRVKRNKRGRRIDSYAIKPGDQLWKLRDPKSIMGVRKYKDVEKLFKMCIAYFKWADTNPLYEQKLAGTYKGAIMKVSLEKKRVFTYSGLYLYLGISSASWSNWNNINHKDYRSELALVKDFVDETIKNQKFEGAAAGLFHANLIMRDLGLTDRQDLTTGGQPISNDTNVEIHNGMDIKDAEKAYKQLLLGE